MCYDVCKNTNRLLAFLCFEFLGMHILMYKHRLMYKHTFYIARLLAGIARNVLRLKLRIECGKSFDIELYSALNGI